MEKSSSGLIAAETTDAIIGSFFDVHNALGFGYRELIYAAAMERALKLKGHQVDREVPVMVYFRGEPLARQLLDMVVDKNVIVELKSTDTLHADAERQLFSYLCSTTLEVGLLLHFGRRANFHRVICENRFKRFSQP